VHISRRQSDKSDLGLDVTAAQMQISINLIRFLMDKDIEINYVVLAEGAAKIVLPQRTTQQESSSALINIDNVEFQNFRVQIDNNVVDVQQVSLKMMHYENASTLSAKGNFTLLTGEIARLHPILKAPAKAKVQFVLDGEKTRINESEITLSGTHIEFSGYISPKIVSLEARCKAGKIENSAHYFVPQDSKIKNPAGKIKAAVKITGTQGIAGRLQIEGSAAIDKAKMQVAEYPLEIDNSALHFSATDMTKAKTYTCNLSNTNVRWADFAALVDAKISNLETPHIVSQMSVSGGLHSLSDVFEKGSVEGQVTIDFHGTDLNHIEKLQSELQIKDATATIQQKRYHFEGPVAVTQHEINTSGLQIDCDYGQGIFKGKIHNYMAIAQEKSHETVGVRGQLTTKYLNVDSILNTNTKNSENALPTFRIKIETDADKLLLFNNLYTATNCLFQYQEDKISITNIRSNAFNGQIFGAVLINTTKPHNFLHCNVDFNAIEIEKIPYFNAYFKQGSLLGSLSGNVVMNSPLTDKGWDVQKMEGTANIAVDNGRMVNFEPIQSLSNYVKKESLTNVRFLTVKNTFTIADGAIHIPGMEIRSSALNTFVEGTHHFNGDFDYRIVLFFSEIMRGKAQSLDNPIKDGKTKIFLTAVQKNGKFKMDYTTDIGKNVKATFEKEKKSFTEAKNKTEDKNQPSPIVIDRDLDEVQSEKKAQQPEKAKAKPQQEKPAVEVVWDDE
jgi:hypothetical protein